MRRNTTSLPETRLIELRADGRRKAGPFVDPTVITQSLQVLDRRGEAWAASVLGRDLSRRSLTVRNRPWLNAGEDHTLVAADKAEDDHAIAELETQL